MSVKKAIIPVAGWGTRRLPITKAIEKAMLPIGNRPLVDYVVEDCIKAGIEEIYFVVDDKPQSQIQAYYSDSLELETHLSQRGKADKLPLIKTKRAGLTMHFLPQKDVNKRYGSAEPVAQAMAAYNFNEPVAVLMGDDFSYNADGSSDLARLIEAQNGDESAMLATEISPEEVEKYGVLKLDSGFLADIYEKPARDEAPSNLVNISKYIFSPALLKQIQAYCENNNFGPEGQEYMITDPIIDHVKAGGKIRVLKIKGQYLDGGSLEGWLRANQVICG